MNDINLHQALSGLHATVTDGNDVLVYTHCIYPSRAQIRVRVKPLPNSHYLISDDAAGLGEILSMGVETKKPGYFLAEQAGRYGVRYHRGEISVEAESLEALPAAVMLVSNASKDGVFRTSLAHEANIKPSFDFTFENYVREKYTGKFRPETITGGSGVSRKFRFVHQRGNVSGLRLNDPIILVEPVAPNPFAIAIKAQAHRDIMHCALPKLWQCLVVDRESDPWTREDIELLKQSGVLWLEFPQADIELSRRIAA